VNYNEMLRLVVGRTGLTRRQADAAVAGTMTVLAETISAKETKDLLAQLPKSLRDRVPVSGEVITMRPIEFVARVAELTGSSTNDEAEMQVRAVLATLTEAVTTGEMRDISEELGDEYADLLGRSPAQKNPATGDPDQGVAQQAASVLGNAFSLACRMLELASRPIVAAARIATRPH
jgi:uncharacterized protein (DUF2267 family)